MLLIACAYTTPSPDYNVLLDIQVSEREQAVEE